MVGVGWGRGEGDGVRIKWDKIKLSKCVMQPSIPVDREI